MFGFWNFDFEEIIKTRFLQLKKKKTSADNEEKMGKSDENSVGLVGSMNLQGTLI